MRHEAAEEARRRLAAVFASAVKAGIMASSNGSASAVPAPRSRARRLMCFLVMNMGSIPTFETGWFHVRGDFMFMVKAGLWTTPMISDENL